MSRRLEALLELKTVPGPRLDNPFAGKIPIMKYASMTMLTVLVSQVSVPAQH